MADQPLQPLVQVLPAAEESPSPSLVVEQARMLVQMEEQRFAAQQSQATTLLAVTGVIASIGSGLVAVFNGQDFEWTVTVFGLSISLAFIAVLLVGLFGVVLGLLQAGQSALGVMQQKPDPAPEKLTLLVKKQFPKMTEGSPPTAAKILLGSLAGQLKVVQEANTEMTVNLKLVSARLARAVLSGIVVAAVMLAGTSGHTQQVEVVDSRGENVATVEGER